VVNLASRQSPRRKRAKQNTQWLYDNPVYACALMIGFGVVALIMKLTLHINGLIFFSVIGSPLFAFMLIKDYRDKKKTLPQNMQIAVIASAVIAVVLGIVTWMIPTTTDDLTGYGDSASASLIATDPAPAAPAVAAPQPGVAPPVTSSDSSHPQATVSGNYPSLNDPLDVRLTKWQALMADYMPGVECNAGWSDQQVLDWLIKFLSSAPDPGQPDPNDPIWPAGAPGKGQAWTSLGVAADSTFAAIPHVGSLETAAHGTIFRDSVVWTVGGAGMTKRLMTASGQVPSDQGPSKFRRWNLSVNIVPLKGHSYCLVAEQQ
jgi:hypothetical protein